MDKKFFMVYIEGENATTAQYDNFKKAENEAKILADRYGKKAFVLESASLIEPNKINKKIDSFELAIKFLGRKNNNLMCIIPDKHAKAMVALYKLFTIAEAWNKADNFIPDFSDSKQYKFFPLFVYNDKAAGFVFANTFHATSYSYAVVGSRLCFSTRERAEQFGKQFIDLWNDFLLFR